MESYEIEWERVIVASHARQVSALEVEESIFMVVAVEKISLL